MLRLTFSDIVTISSNIQKFNCEDLLMVFPFPSEDPDDAASC